MDPADPGADTALARLPGPRPGIEDSAADAEPCPDPAASANQPSAGPARPPALRPRERAVLDFELKRWKHAGAKEEAIRATFELSPTRYFQILNALLDDPAALAYQPSLVTRLRRIRDARRAARD